MYEDIITKPTVWDAYFKKKRLHVTLTFTLDLCSSPSVIVTINYRAGGLKGFSSYFSSRL